MAENILSEIRQLLQDVISPDLKALAVRGEGNQRHTELAMKAPLRERLATLEAHEARS